jgi:hypothetical protein
MSVLPAIPRVMPAVIVQRGITPRPVLVGSAPHMSVLPAIPRVMPAVIVLRMIVRRVTSLLVMPAVIVRLGITPRPVLVGSAPHMSVLPAIPRVMLAVIVLRMIVRRVTSLLVMPAVIVPSATLLQPVHVTSARVGIRDRLAAPIATRIALVQPGRR